MGVLKGLLGVRRGCFGGLEGSQELCRASGVVKKPLTIRVFRAHLTPDPKPLTLDPRSSVVQGLILRGSLNAEALQLKSFGSSCPARNPQP